MKKSSFLVLILALTLLVGAVIGINAQSEENTPEIMSYNVQYGSYFYMQAAVDPASVGGEGKTVKVNLYASAEAAEPAASATAEYVTENIPADFGGAAYIAAVPYGISFTDMAKTVYLEAECDGVKGEKVAYSIVEYLLQRLYKDGEIDVAGDQRELYLNTLAFGKSVDTLDADKADKVADYRYVAVTGGTANGKAGGLLVKKGTTVTFATDAAAGEWSVITYDADNKATISLVSFEDGAAGIVVNNNMVLSAEPLTPKAGIYADLLGSYDYTEFDTAAEYNNNGYAYAVSTSGSNMNNDTICSSHVYAQYDTAPGTVGNRIYMNIAEDPTDATNKVLKYYKYAEEDTINGVVTGYGTMDPDIEEYNTLVFETDFYVAPLTEASEATMGEKPDAQLIQFAFASSAEAAANESRGLEGWKITAATTWMASVQQRTLSDGSYSYYVTGFRDTSRNPAYVSDLDAATINLGEWNTLTIELDASACRVYVNGNLVSTVASLGRADFDSFDSCFIKQRGFLNAQTDGFGVYLDNTYLGYIQK